MTTLHGGNIEGQNMAEAITKTATTVTYVAGGVGGVFGILTFQEWLSLGTFGVIVVTMFINWYYQQKRLEIMQSQAKQNAD